MQENTELRRKVRNPKLYEILKDLINSFSEVLEQRFSLDYGSWYDRVKVLVQADSELIAKILEKRPDLEEKKLSRCLISSQKALNALAKEEICRNPPHASTVEGYQEELAFFLEKLFKARDRIRIRGLFAKAEGFQRHFDHIFLEEYLRYENYLYDDSVSDFVICPLQNFICSREIELDNQLMIRKITQNEFHSLVEATERYGYELESYPEFVLYVAINDKNWHDSIQKVITSLRLVKKERVGLTRIFNAYALPSRPWKIADALEGTKFTARSTEAFYILHQSEEDALKRLFTLLNQTMNAGYLAMSFRRFNLAYERERLEDSWIDLFVSLESLYSKESEITEVTHRLATRLSRALGGKSLDDRKHLRDEIKNWYNIRSKIVHGGSVSLKETQLKDLEDILRNSLKWFMNCSEYTHHDKIIDLLDLGS